MCQGGGHRVDGVGGIAEDQVGVWVDSSAAWRVEAVQEGVHRVGVGIAEGGGSDGLLGSGDLDRAVFGHQRFDGEAPLGSGLKHGGPGGSADRWAPAGSLQLLHPRPSTTCVRPSVCVCVCLRVCVPH